MKGLKVFVGDEEIHGVQKVRWILRLWFLAAAPAVVLVLLAEMILR